jgi:hypothetical protein
MSKSWETTQEAAENEHKMQAKKRADQAWNAELARRQEQEGEKNRRRSTKKHSKRGRKKRLSTRRKEVVFV